MLSCCLPAYATTLVDYIDKLNDGWRGYALTPCYGITVATGVIETLLGKEFSPESMGGEPMWLKIHRVIVMTSRTQDLWAAPPKTPAEDMVGIETHASAHCVFSLLLDFKKSSKALEPTVCVGH